MARFTWRTLVLVTLAGVAVLLCSGTASAEATESCETGCGDASDTASPEPLGSSLNAVNGLVQDTVGGLLGHGKRPVATTSPDAATPGPAKGTAPGLAQQATDPTATALPAALPAASPSLDIAEPVVSTVTSTVQAAVPVANTLATPAGDLLTRDLLEGQPLQEAVGTATGAMVELGAAAVPAVAATVQTLDATTQQLLGTVQATTTAVLDSAQRVAATATSTLRPVTDSITGALAIALSGPTPAGSAPMSATQAEPGSGVNQFGGATTLGDTLPNLGIAFPGPRTDLVTRASSADGRVPTPPPDQISGEASADDGGSALALTGQHSAPVTAASGAGSANGGGTSGPSATELGKVFFDLTPAAPQPGFVPALHHSAHVPSAPVVEPAQSPD